MADMHDVLIFTGGIGVGIPPKEPTSRRFQPTPSGLPSAEEQAVRRPAAGVRTTMLWATHAGSRVWRSITGGVNRFGVAAEALSSAASSVEGLRHEPPPVPGQGRVGQVMAGGDRVHA